MGLYRLSSAALLILFAVSLPLASRELEVRKGRVTIKEGETSAEVAPGEVSISTEGTKIEVRGEEVEIQTSDARISLKDSTSKEDAQVSIDTPHYRVSLSSDGLKIAPAESSPAVQNRSQPDSETGEKQAADSSPSLKPEQAQSNVSLQEDQFEDPEIIEFITFEETPVSSSASPTVDAISGTLAVQTPELVVVQPVEPESIALTSIEETEFLPSPQAAVVAETVAAQPVEPESIALTSIEAAKEEPAAVQAAVATEQVAGKEEELFKDEDIVDLALFEEPTVPEKEVAAILNRPEPAAVIGKESLISKEVQPLVPTEPISIQSSAPTGEIKALYMEAEPIDLALAKEPSLPDIEAAAVSKRSEPAAPIAQEIASAKEINRTEKGTSLKEIAVFRGSEAAKKWSGEQGIRLEKGLFTPKQSAELCERLTPFLGRNLMQGDLDKIRKTVADVFTSTQVPLTSVMIPPQDVTDGTLQVAIYQSKVGEVSVRGNNWYPTKEILKGSELKAGDALYLKRLERNLAIYNRNPFIRVDAVLRPGSSVETTDVDLVVMDRFPFRPYVGGDNTGVQFTDKPRFYAGFTAGRLFGTDQQFSYQFTTTDQPEEFAAHIAIYTAPFPWAAQSFVVYGGWARVRGTMPSEDMKNKGTAWQVSGRYQIPISPFYGTVIEEIYFGYDFKRTNNSFLFGGDTVSQQGADINQFVLGCILDFHSRVSKTSLVVEVFGSPWRLTGAQSVTRYSELRFDAKPLYAYGRLRLSHTRDLLLGFQFKGMLAGQGTGWNLLPSEEFGLGGYATVRGYEERALNTDSGINASIELLTPKLRLFSPRKKDYSKEELRFLAFLDYGMGIYSVPAPGQRRMEWLMGAGGGVRYNYSTNIVLRCDVGAPLHHAGEGRHGMHVHTGGTLSY